MNNKSVIIATGYDYGVPDHSITGFSNQLNLYRIDSFRSVNHLKLTWMNQEKKGIAGDEFEAVIELENKGDVTIYSGRRLYLNYTFIKTRKEFFVSEKTYPVANIELVPGYKMQVPISINIPKEKGGYKLIISIVQIPFAGNFSSPFYDVEVD